MGEEVGREGVFFFQAEDGIRVPLWSRGLGDVYQSQDLLPVPRHGVPPIPDGFTPSTPP